jgi:hypothetical protein
MGTLFISFLVAIGGAVGLVVMSKTLDLETYTSRIFPLIPILYAIVYEVIEKRRTGKAKTIPPSEARKEMRSAAAAIFENITVGRIAGNVGIAFLIKFCLEILLTFVHLAVANQTFGQAYGTFGVETVGRILRGDHPWLGDSQGIVLLALIAVTTSLGTGLWIGNATRANAILEGVLTGAAVTFITSMTNLLILYRQIEELADRSVEAFGYVSHIGFIVVITLQVLLYGLWSGMANRAKCERDARREEKRAAKKSRK